MVYYKRGQNVLLKSTNPNSYRRKDKAVTRRVVTFCSLCTFLFVLTVATPAQRFTSDKRISEQDLRLQPIQILRTIKKAESFRFTGHFPGVFSERQFEVFKQTTIAIYDEAKGGYSSGMLSDVVVGNHTWIVVYSSKTGTVIRMYRISKEYVKSLTPEMAQRYEDYRIKYPVELTYFDNKEGVVQWKTENSRGLLYLTSSTRFQDRMTNTNVLYDYFCKNCRKGRWGFIYKQSDKSVVLAEHHY
jgi:hypothetical protein